MIRGSVARLSVGMMNWFQRRGMDGVRSWIWRLEMKAALVYFDLGWDCGDAASGRVYSVSGRQHNTMINMMPSHMAANLKHHLQPRYWPTGPPRSGAM